MRAILGILLVLVLAVIAALALGLINLDARGGSLPQIRAEGGSLPKVGVETGKVEVGTKTETVKVPTVEVKKAGE